MGAVGRHSDVEQPDLRSDTVGPRGLINRREYIRLLEQALLHIGYPELAAKLEHESGIEMQPQVATTFRKAVTSGNFQVALDLLPSLGLGPNPASIQRARFLLLSQKYTEAISTGDFAAALQCLRHELQPLQDSLGESVEHQGRTLPGLAAMLLSCGPTNNGGGSSSHSTDESITQSRAALLAELQALLPPSLLIPDARLMELVEQALLAQLDRCPYHNSRSLQMSLFVDYVAGPEQLPTATAQVLDTHTDEVWAVQFSCDGRWLATASKDGSALLWSVTTATTPELTLARFLLRGPHPVNIATFSPNATMVLVGASDGRLRLYGLPSGDLRLEVQVASSGDGIGAAAWLPDSRHVIVATNRELQVLDLEAGGVVVDRVSTTQHVYDVLLSQDGGTCVSAGQDRRLRFLRLSDRKEVFLGPEPSSVTCMSGSPDGRFVAANLANGAIHIWPLGDLRAPSEPQASSARPGSSDPMDALPSAPLQELRTGEASTPGRFVIRSAFGGAGCAFLASGSESAHVHIWHRESGELLASLEGHSGTVNAVAWNPCNEHMLVSASDDHTVRVWLAPAVSHRDH